MLKQFHRTYRGHAIEIMLTPTMQGCETWFIVDGNVPSHPMERYLHNVDLAVKTTLRSAEAWIDSRFQ